jgi:[ribosomal protein S5]-alanine N-acetyltransferase
MPSLVKPVAALPTGRSNDQPFICLPGVDVVLRPWASSDAAQLKAAFRDREIRRWCLHRLDTVSEGRHWIDHWNKRWRKRTGASWAIVHRKRSDIVLGQVGFRSLYVADGMAEVSYWIMPKFRRQHFATDATHVLAEWALKEMGLERVELVHSTFNDASCQVALGAGFHIEGVKRHLQIHADGFHDMCLHSRISSDDGKPISSPLPTPPIPLVTAGHDAALWLKVLRKARRAKRPENRPSKVATGA